MLLTEAEFINLERRISCDCVTVFEITMKEITVFLSEMLWIWRMKQRDREYWQRELPAPLTAFFTAQLQEYMEEARSRDRQTQMKTVHNSSFEETGAHFWRNPILQCRDIIAQSAYTCLSHKEVVKRGGETTSGSITRIIWRKRTRLAAAGCCHVCRCDLSWLSAG